MADDAERFYGLRDELDTELQVYRRSADQPLPTAHTDETGAVTVAIDPADGVLSATITEAWRDAYEPDGLGGAVVATFQALAVDRAAQWAQNVDAARDDVYHPSPTPPVDDSFAAKVERAISDAPDRGEAMARVLGNVLEVFDDISQNLDATFATVLAQDRTVLAASREMEVTLSSGGDLVRVDIDANWVQTAAAATITRELNIAFMEAHERAEASPTLLENTPLGRYQRFADDPDSFLRHLIGKD